MQKRVRRLFRDSEHEVDVDVVKSGVARHAERACKVLPRMDAGEGFQLVVVRGLQSHAQPVHAEAAQPGEGGIADRRRIGLDGELRVFREGEDLLHRADQAEELLREDRGGRASADEHGIRHILVADGGAVTLHVGDDGVDVAGDDVRGVRHHGIEVAVGALRAAEGDVDVDPERTRTVQGFVVIHNH